jgi:hypothetical protein
MKSKKEATPKGRKKKSETPPDNRQASCRTLPAHRQFQRSRPVGACAPRSNSRMTLAWIASRSATACSPTTFSPRCRSAAPSRGRLRRSSALRPRQPERPPDSARPISRTGCGRRIRSASAGATRTSCGCQRRTTCRRRMSTGSWRSLTNFDFTLCPRRTLGQNHFLSSRTNTKRRLQCGAVETLLLRRRKLVASQIVGGAGIFWRLHQIARRSGLLSILSSCVMRVKPYARAVAPINRSPASLG